MKYDFPGNTLLFLAAILLISGCGGKSNSQQITVATSFDVQGHRGCRGLLPENSIEGFLRAYDLGVTTLEMDVVISKDHQVLLSHEPFISHLICRDSLGRPIDAFREKEYNIYQMDYRQIAGFDCGSQGHPDFPRQEKIAMYKPLLKAVIKAVETHRLNLGLDPIYYNIETKCSPLGDNVFHPPPDQFVRLLVDVIRENGIEQRTIIQSFDPRTLQQTRIQAPELQLALLVENEQSPEDNISRLGFTPGIYSPEHILVDHKMLAYLKNNGIKLIPWTVNEPSEMRKYLDLGVYGIITDYPDLLLEILEERQNSQ